MVIPELKHLCPVLIALLLPFSASAQIYKWVDEHGVTHFAAQPPADTPAETVEVPPPPPMSDTDPQDEVDALLEEQRARDAQRELEQQQTDEEAQRQADMEENCRILKQNLQQYQDNPGRRIMDADGNVTRLDEEERQRIMQELREDIETFCQ